jgi:hypothetical protein
MSNNKIFEGRRLLIATKHKKESVIAPILEKELGVNCFVTAIDTDRFGTFTGDIARKEDSISTARNKCLLAMEIENCDLVLASEGSFGAHPTLFFANADEEILLFIDKKNDLEIIVKELSLETNFNGSEIKTIKELKEFVENSKFPTHGIILRNEKNDAIDIEKGITDLDHLYKTFKYLISKYGSAFIETDMRAMYNPTRMKVIEKATYKLAQKINSLCPKCSNPGFGIIHSKSGLPCNLCNFPTQSTFSHIYSCQKCNYIKEDFYPNGRENEDPMFCDICNP